MIKISETEAIMIIMCIDTQTNPLIQIILLKKCITSIKSNLQVPFSISFAVFVEVIAFT